MGSRRKVHRKRAVTSCELHMPRPSESSRTTSAFYILMELSMSRRFAFTVALALWSAAPAMAQSHPTAHSGPRQHGSGHVRPDSATHAAMHALLHGTWTGTLTAAHGSKALNLTFADDSMPLVFHADQSAQFGRSADFRVKGQELQWTQEVAGAPCKASAVVTAATPQSPESFKGKMECADGARSFVLHRKAS